MSVFLVHAELSSAKSAPEDRFTRAVQASPLLRELEERIERLEVSERRG